MIVFYNLSLMILLLPDVQALAVECANNNVTSSTVLWMSAKNINQTFEIESPNLNKCISPNATEVHLNWADKTTMYYYNNSNNNSTDGLNNILITIPIASADYPCEYLLKNNEQQQQKQQKQQHQKVSASEKAQSFFRGLWKSIVQAVMAPITIYEHHQDIIPALSFMIHHPKNATHALVGASKQSCAKNTPECVGVIIGNLALIFVSLGAEFVLEIEGLAVQGLRAADTIHVAGLGSDLEHHVQNCHNNNNNNQTVH
jgi:hypothetical protein